MLPGLVFSRVLAAGSGPSPRQRGCRGVLGARAGRGPAPAPHHGAGPVLARGAAAAGGVRAERAPRAAPAVPRCASCSNQLRSPLLLLLVFAAGASALTGEWVDAAIVLAIVVASVGIGYSREYRAQAAAAALRARVQTRATRPARRRSRRRSRSRRSCPGDVVLLSAGSLVPADAVVLEATDCFVSEAVLTGESFPVEKRPGVVARGGGARASARTASSSAPTCAAAPRAAWSSRPARDRSSAPSRTG